MAVLWVVAPCSLVEVYHRFRGPCCLRHQGGGTSETSADFYQTTRRYNPEDSHLHLSVQSAGLSNLNWRVAGWLWIIYPEDCGKMGSFISSGTVTAPAWRDRENLKVYFQDASQTRCLWVNCPPGMFVKTICMNKIVYHWIKMNILYLCTASTHICGSFRSAPIQRWDILISDWELR
jgi:hypothetical protein